MKKSAFIFLIFIVGDCFAGNIESYRTFFDALVLEKSGKYEEALKLYKKTITLDDEPFLYRSALRMSMLTGNIGETLEYSRLLVEKDSSTVENWYIYANALWAKGDKKLAQEAFEKGIAIDNEHAESYYQLAALNANDVKKAMEYLNKLIQIRPDLKAEAYMRAAEIYYGDKNLSKALEYLKKSAEADPFYSKPRYMLAIYYEDSGNFPQAIEEYKKILEAEGDSEENLNKIGELYLSLQVNDLNAAERYFLRALDINANNPQTLYWLNVLYELNKDYAKAEDYAKKLQQTAPSAANAVKLSYYKSIEGDINAAMDILKEAYKKWPENPELCYFLGLGYQDLKDDDKAREFLLKAVSLGKGYDEASFQLAVVCERLNDVKCFRENFEALIKKDPLNHTAMNYLGYSLADRGLEIDYAMGLINKALSLDSANGAYMDSLAWAYFKKKEIQAAADEIKKSLAKTPNDSIINRHAGEIFQALGDFGNAWKYFTISNLIEQDKQILKKSLALSGNINFKNKFSDYMSEIYYSQGQEFYLPCEVNIEMGKEKFSADCFLSRKSNGDFYFKVLDPFKMPLFSFSRVSEAQEISMPENISTPEAGQYLKAVSLFLETFFEGSLFDFSDLQLKGKKFYGKNMEIKLNKEKNFIDEIAKKKDTPLKAKVEKFFRNGKIGVSSINIKMHGTRINFKPIYE